MSRATLWASLLFACAASFDAEIVDRIAATVGSEVIAESAVRDEVRLTAFLDGIQPDFSKDNRRKALDRMIDQCLVRREVEFTRFPSASDADVESLLAQAKAPYASAPAWSAALAERGITQADVTAHLRWQLTMLRFIEYRFQPAVQVTDAELRQEYRRQSQAWREKNAGEPPSIDDMRPELEKIVRQRLTDSGLDRWLGEMRTQTRILYRGDYQ
jgi:hypothetical protein